MQLLLLLLVQTQPRVRLELRPVDLRPLHVGCVGRRCRIELAQNLRGRLPCAAAAARRAAARSVHRVSTKVVVDSDWREHSSSLPKEGENHDGAH